MTTCLLGPGALVCRWSWPQLLGLAGGKVQQGAGQPGDPGLPPPGGEKAKAPGGTHSLSQPVYWLEVPRDLHQCRHADPNMCS